MSTVEQDKNTLRTWEEKLRIAQRAHETNARQGYPLKQRFEELQRSTEKLQVEKRTLETDRERLKNDLRQLETRLRRIDNEKQQHDRDFSRAKDVWQEHQRTVQTIEKNLADAKWEVGNWKVQVSKSEAIERTEKEKLKVSARQQRRGF